MIEIGSCTTPSRHHSFCIPFLIYFTYILSVFAFLDKNAGSFRFLVRVNDTSKSMWKCFFTYVMAVNLLASLVVVPLISVYLDWLMNKSLNVGHFHHVVPSVYVKFKIALPTHIKSCVITPPPFQCSLPWNQTTLVGYFGELGFQLPVGFGFFFYSGVFLLLFISICQHHVAFYKMFKHSMNQMKRPADENSRCAAKNLCDLIRFHILVIT